MTYFIAKVANLFSEVESQKNLMARLNTLEHSSDTWVREAARDAVKELSRPANSASKAP
jgi:hypothetical protein